MAPPIANVMAASWNGGIFPDAVVNSASSDHSRIAAKPMSVAAARELIGFMSGVARMSTAICGGRRRVTARSNPDVASLNRATRYSLQIMYWPPFAEIVEPVMRPASSEARKTTQRAISSGSPRRPIGISGRTLFSSTSFGTACTISVLM